MRARPVSKGGYTSGLTPPHKLGPPPASVGAGTIRAGDDIRRATARILLEELIEDVGHEKGEKKPTSGPHDSMTAAEEPRQSRSLRSILAPQQVEALTLVLTGRSGPEVATAMGLPAAKVVALLSDAFNALLREVSPEVEGGTDASPRTAAEAPAAETA